MKRIFVFFYCFAALIFVVFSSCAPDLTDDEDTVKGINMWSSRSSSEMDWYEAVDYCNNLKERGCSDWRLPTISELRTLIQNCSKTELGGSCGVTDSCLSYAGCRNDACSGCDHNSSGYYSKLGDTDWFWSSSTRSDHSNRAWRVDFDRGGVYGYGVDYNSYVRCVR